MKRLISLLLCLGLILVAFPFTASATTDNYDTVYDILTKGIADYEEIIYIDEYNISIGVFTTLYNDIVANEPLLFNTKSCKYAYYGEQVLYIKPTYIMTREEYIEALAYVDEEINAILAGMPKGLDDYEKALYLYDYIALNFCYDLNLTIRTLYDFLKEKTGVCAAYTLLYDELLTRIGIENYAVHSASMKHVWNEIKINDNWYHVDLTWADPVSSTNEKGYYGRVWHDDFLCSDEVFFETHADDIVTKYPCTDTTYDDLTWKYSNFPVGFANGNPYILDTDNIWLIDLASDDLTYVFDTNSQRYYSEITGKYYTNYPYFGSYNDKLIYHNGESLLSYDPLTDTTEVLHTPETDEAIALFYVSGNTINYIIGSTNVAEEGTEYTFVIQDVMLGDINGDGNITAVDYISLKRVVMGSSELSVSSAVWDINGDGICSAVDYITIKRVVMGTYVFN